MNQSHLTQDSKRSLALFIALATIGLGAIIFTLSPVHNTSPAQPIPPAPAETATSTSAATAQDLPDKKSSAYTPTPPRTPTAPTTQNDTSTRILFNRADIIQRVNAYRIENALPPLVENRLLDDAAQVRGAYIGVTGRFSHDLGTDVDFAHVVVRAGYKGKRDGEKFFGENLAEGFTNAEQVVDAWRQSPAHNTVILHPVPTEIGVAVIPAVYQGRVTVFTVLIVATPL